MWSDFGPVAVKFVVNVAPPKSKQNRRDINEQWSHYRPHHGPGGAGEEEEEEFEGRDRDEKRETSATSLLGE